VGEAVVLPLLAVVASGVLGCGAGVGLHVLLREKRLPRALLMRTTLQARLRAACIVAAATGCFAVAQAANLEPLLACVTMGLYAVNPREKKYTEVDREELEVRATCPCPGLDASRRVCRIDEGYPAPKGA
jgi:NhaP-type Na+/H+ or K+/H+ antiporter